MTTESNNRKIILTLEGVVNEDSALIVDKGLSKLQGVIAHRVELNNKQAIIEASNAEVVSKAINTIKELGYGVTTLKKTFPVLEMSCASCAMSVQSILKSQLGIVDASVNFATATVAVEYIPGAVDSSDFKKALQSVGFDILIEEDKSQSDTLETLHQEKFDQLKKKTYLALALSAPVAVIGMFFMNMPFANLIMWILSTPVVFWLGSSFFTNAWKQAKNRNANMDTLVALSTGVAYTFSVFNTLFSYFWVNRGLEAHVYFEAAAVVVTFVLLGRLLEEKAKGNTSTALKKLMGLQPKTVTIIHDDPHQMEIPIEQVQIGNIILVKPGEKIAVDGTLINGNSYVDESMLSGEPLPVFKKENETVYSGTINQKGSFQFRADKIGSDTMLAHIIKMVQDAQGSKAPVQKLVDKIAGIFVPVVMLIAIVAFITWNVLGGENGFTQGLLALVTVLVIACPCALGLATPTAIMVGVGKAAENGILIKDAESLQLAKKINAIVLDKTGTITEGKPIVTNEFWTENKIDLKSILLSIEKQSEHPLADAVVKHLQDQSTATISEFESITGKGAKAFYDGETYFIGNRSLLEERKIITDDTILEMSELWSKEAKTVVWFSNSKKTLAILAIADQIKSTSKSAIAELQKNGIEVYMLTGDNEATAKAVASNVGINHFKGEVMPDQKATFVKQLQTEGKIVAMVGDGINDSAALAQSDVSIAMGKGSDIAMDVAKMTIVSSNLAKISEAIRMSKHTVATIKQNLFWAFIYNLIGIPIAAGILYPINGFLLNPMIAGAAMALSSVSVVSNSLRLKWKK